MIINSREYFTFKTYRYFYTGKKVIWPWEVNPRVHKKSRLCSRLPCRPTISATCSLLGTGTHSVIFWLFLERASSKTPAGVVCKGSGSLAVPVPVPVPVPGHPGVPSRPSIDNSNANCRALWSSREAVPPPLAPRSISLNKLVGMSLD